MIDRDGYRPNVGIVLCNWKNEVFWGKRVREHSWQFPQGGIKGGVRLLLVVDADRRVHGLVTANDILGEKPVKTAVQQGVHRSEVQVRDIMTPRDALEALDIRDVETATVGHIVTTLKAAGRQHTLVVDQDTKGRQRVRGVFSATQIARQLGIVISTEAVACTFAEIEASLGH